MCEQEYLQCENCGIKFRIRHSCWTRHGTIAPCKYNVPCKEGVTVVSRNSCGRCYDPEDAERAERKRLEMVDIEMRGSISTSSSDSSSEESESDSEHDGLLVVRMPRMPRITTTVLLKWLWAWSRA